jgi:hypothetical protein
MSIEWIEEKYHIFLALKVSPVYVRWTVYTTAIVSMIVLGVWKSADFIYFQF